MPVYIVRVQIGPIVEIEVTANNPNLAERVILDTTQPRGLLRSPQIMSEVREVDVDRTIISVTLKP